MHLSVCDLTTDYFEICFFSSDSFFLSCSLFYYVFLLITPTDMHTAWINSSTLLSTHSAAEQLLLFSNPSTKWVMWLNTLLRHYYLTSSLISSTFFNPYKKQVPLIYSFYNTTQGRLHIVHLLQVIINRKKWLQVVIGMIDTRCYRPDLHIFLHMCSVL